MMHSVHCEPPLVNRGYTRSVWRMADGL